MSPKKRTWVPIRKETPRSFVPQTETVSFQNCESKIDTGRAVLVHIPEHGDEFIPHSVIDDASEIWGDEGNTQGTLVIARGFAKKKGWL